MINGNDIIKLGYPKNHLIGLALKAARATKADEVFQYEINEIGGVEEDTYIKELLVSVSEFPYQYRQDDDLLPEVMVLANAWCEYIESQTVPADQIPNPEARPYEVFNSHVDVQHEAVVQMDNAMRLPIARGGAIMPDGQFGYGLPVGGVWQTWNAVSPNAVGSDIACQVNATIFYEQEGDYIPAELQETLMSCTRFKFDNHQSDHSGHPVFHSYVWDDNPFLAANPQIKEMTIKQFGSSGDGNHFANFGYLFGDRMFKFGRLAFVTHWGSRSLGARIAKHYSELAEKECKHLPPEYMKLAWLDTTTDLGAEYKEAMELAEWYASAGHAYVHNLVETHLGLHAVDFVKSVHNLAWQEGDFVVHRKGATPAHKGVRGVIPMSMTEPTYLVEGKGNDWSIDSASHGAGRTMSRSRAKKELSKERMVTLLRESGVRLIGAALDESPEAYKNPADVIASQDNCIEVIGKIQPTVVRMAA